MVTEWLKSGMFADLSDDNAREAAAKKSLTNWRATL
jgi:hypothetical protein